MEKTQSVREHLLELRKRIFGIIIVGAIVFFAGLAFSGKILHLITTTIKNPLIVTSPVEIVTTMINLSLIITLLIIIPYIFYQIVEFVKPTIKIKFLLYLPFFSTLLFLAGMITGYFMAVFTTEFMSQMAAGIGVVNMWTISSYLNLLIITSLMFGIVFQMPLLMLLLTKTGIIPLKFFKGMRPWVIFIMLCTIAIISPQGDVVSLIVMSMPVIIMYELGIFVSSRVANHRLEEA